MDKSEELLLVQPAGKTQAVSSFANLSKLLFHPDYNVLKDSFVKDLKAAALGEPSTLSFLRHYIPQNPLIASGIVQGIVIGGTHFATSTEQLYPNGKRKVISRKKGRTPILKDSKVLYAFLKEILHPDAEAIGLSMAFPLKAVNGTLGELDGIIEYGTKEHTLSGFKGVSLGTWIKTKFKKNIPVSVGNDVLCLTLLSRGYEEGGFIAATGVNMGIKESKKVAVNLESGNFTAFDADDILNRIDAASQNKGKNRFEKMASGKYLPEQFNEIANQYNLGTFLPRIKKAHELSALAVSPEPSVAKDLARFLLERSAALVAVQIAGLYEFKGRPEKLGLIGEGSLLWKGWEFVNNIQKALEKLGVPPGTISIRKVRDSSMEGAFALITA